MAIQFAKKSQKLEAEPYVYRLDFQSAKRYLIKTTNLLKELFEDSRFCIIGGGGVLRGGTTLLENGFPEFVNYR